MKEITDLNFLELKKKVENIALNHRLYVKEHKKKHSEHSEMYYWSEWLDEKQLMERKITEQELRIHALEILYGDLSRK